MQLPSNSHCIYPDYNDIRFITIHTLCKNHIVITKVVSSNITSISRISYPGGATSQEPQFSTRILSPINQRPSFLTSTLLKWRQAISTSSETLDLHLPTDCCLHVRCSRYRGLLRIVIQQDLELWIRRIVVGGRNLDLRLYEDLPI